MSYASRSDEITRDYFNSILVSTSYIDSDIPSTALELFGCDLKTPVMTAALSHLGNTCDNGMAEFARGAYKAGAMHFVGMSADPDSNTLIRSDDDPSARPSIRDRELEDILATGAHTVKIIKPHADEDVIFARLDHAREHGAVAVGMDIDHAISHKGDYDVVLGLPMRTKSFDQLEEYIRYARLPFVVKGVLSISDAVKSAEAGASAIIISHHHGMMDSMVPPLMVLPEIRKELGPDFAIFADCGFESGLDVFKALALGADAVCVGRALMEPLKKGSDAVASGIERITGELAAVMARTGATSLLDIDPGVLRFRAF